MKLLHLVLFLLSVLALLSPASGQITLTSGDMSAYLAPGHTLTSHIDTATHQLDIGATGSTSWDFSGLVQAYTAGSVTINPDTSSFFADFPSATHGIKAGGLISFLQLGTDLSLLGNEGTTPFSIKIVLMPAEITDKLPMTMGTAWTSTYSDTSKTVISGTTYTSVSSVVVDNSVDAYGTMTLPGGGMYAALRLRSDRHTTISGHTNRSISYQYLAKNGASVTIVPSDTLQNSTGTINIASAAWIAPIVTSVAGSSKGSLPSTFALAQNYPNPFNPSTVIRYQLPSAGHVSLKVYNVLGEMVAALVSADQGPGAREVEWDASAVPSGVYYYRLELTGSEGALKDLTQVRKMLLMR